MCVGNVCMCVRIVCMCVGIMVVHLGMSAGIWECSLMSGSVC